MAKLVFLGRLEDVAAADELQVELVGICSLSAALQHLPETLVSALTSPKIRIALNGELIAVDRRLDDVAIGDADEIAFLPPVSGG